MVEHVNCSSKRLHKNCISSLSLYENRIATGGKDSTVNLLEISNSEFNVVHTFNLLNENIIRFNANSVDLFNENILCGTSAGIIYSIDAHSGNINKIAAHTNAVTCVKLLSFERNLILSTSFDKKGKVWDTRHTKVPLYELIGHTANVNFADTFPFQENKNDYTVTFGESYERILTVASDRTARLWNLNSGTHLAFAVPATLSQNVECCRLIMKKPHFIFAIGLDAEYLLIYSSKLKKPITTLSLGEHTWITCIEWIPDFLIVGTNLGQIYLIRDASTLWKLIATIIKFKYIQLLVQKLDWDDGSPQNQKLQRIL
ncbi:bifunctional WD40-YVTN repeat-like-containing domain superfamily/WD40-repeat-containing domain superfamily/WD40 repeat/Ribosomal RNA-processing protein Rrp9-like [Babesia duncani]|uniref:Bifunctional WD40-YVTN repeat-like-containing domain superfamily/WD40-repeat-containing domain superfamily/WD40 repeat/Ribosomal RNA-processing protein Rrp9-like n=1 Tax=Babesia duncani TaxID=323732 RepID=A0AAD9PM58_9APIC|nr:bifunctional WD40-YVTN repeat-like-containing domain superfamily/WD40-repeat-containing domain superfamily/WD40 repeat/Ribosomal RNA-processing protein Rrp9-like [Babesia duncani]KAK2196933.1 bifunctional WD40-YVTN repeat-like-containing domain superfamily/WD40-repeat-containing domain superfamily/WD40 repeat/Ribosomal RNA-processing protein Rrp9-like [Babesia duncani]